LTVQVYLPAYLVERLDQLCELEGSDRRSLITQVLDHSLNYLLWKKHGEQAAYLPPLTTYGKHRAEAQALAFTRVRSQNWVRGFFHALLAHYYPQTANKSRAVAELLGDEGLVGYLFAESLIKKTGKEIPSIDELEAMARRMEAEKRIR
jgi:hypothetical protein